jgi:hypothetical protein
MVLFFILGSNLGGVGPVGVFGEEKEGGGVRSGPGAARTILLSHIISDRPSKQPLKVNMDPTSTMHQWLTLKELQCGVKHHDAAQADYRKELEMLAKAIRTQEPNAGSRVELMSGGEVLGTALIKWLKDGEEDINVAREVVQVVWPRVCEGRSPTHSA